MINFFNKCIYLLSFLIPTKRKKVVFCSYPDYSDNCKALSDYLLSNSSYDEYQIYWLVDNPEKINQENNYRLHFYKKNSLKGVFAFLKSYYIFFTHGMFGNYKYNNKMIVNLWHGMPLKNIGKLDDETRNIDISFNYTLATSELFNKIISSAFDCESSHCLNLGLPRNDFLFCNDKSIFELNHIKKDKYHKIIMWLPTYRSTPYRKKIDGINNSNFIPVLSIEELKKLNILLQKLNYFLIIKLHPMQDISIIKDISLDNIKVMHKFNGDLYKLLGQCDCLWTDYSSVYIDFLILNRPIVFIYNDINEYENNRGFVFDDISQYMPGKHIHTYNQLISFINEFDNNIDNFKQERERINLLFNNYTDARNSERLVKYLKMKN